MVKKMVKKILQNMKKEEVVDYMDSLYSSWEYHEKHGEEEEIKQIEQDFNTIEELYPDIYYSVIA